MKRRWSYLKWKLWRHRAVILGIAGLSVMAFMLLGNSGAVAEQMQILYRKYGVHAADSVMAVWFCEGQSEEEYPARYFLRKPKVLEYMEQLPKNFEQGEDPAYERLLAGVWEAQILKENETTPEKDQVEEASFEPVMELVNFKTSGSALVREKLSDHDYLMKEFYVVHPTTAADGTLINAERFLNMDLTVEKQESSPQILIYHTHSQEEFADHSQNQEATIVGVGAYLKELLEEQGYNVIHDTSNYDMKNGTLDRNQAYTYALDGISGILQRNPSIEVVLDLHRDGVEENTQLVTEVNGKPTARIMFFNGTSQTPDGPIEYLQNPNREANLAFSFQLQLEAAEQYPGFTRKIYLKGLRYNQHVRARSALIEVGAQTNTYAEALNAMEPLADILCRVLGED
ncbi:MAG: stage II sporulation protein P [Lachnospiraceae bacterium]|nr:stage II sporulation protein P [Lachnospiraceae bacterium]